MGTVPNCYPFIWKAALTWFIPLRWRLAAISLPFASNIPSVLANIAGKSYGQIFREFEGKQDPKSVQGSGDVKYHLGTEGEFTAEGGATTKVYLAANPSHLEAVNPVLEGVVRGGAAPPPGPPG